MDPRDTDVGGVEPGRHLGHRVGLAPKVQLGAQSLRELLEQFPGAHDIAERGAPLGEVRQQPQCREIALHRDLDPGSLDLDDHRLARVQASAMGLTDRCRRQRLPLELGEHAVDVVAELGGEHRLDALPRLWWHLVLQRRQFRADVRRQQVHSGGGDLPELDVHPSGLLEHATESDRLAVERPSAAIGAGEKRPEALLASQVEELPVAAQDRDPRLHGAYRMGSDQQSCPLPDRQRSGTSQEVERDGGGHRRRHTDGEDVQDQAVRSPIPRGDPERNQAGDAPSEQSAERGRAPAAANPEQAQRQDGDHQDEGESHDRAHAFDWPRGSEQRLRTPGHQSPPRHGGAPTPHKDSPDRSATSATSAERGWKERAASRPTITEPLAPLSKS